jgi:hypothetical protein
MSDTAQLFIMAGVWTVAAAILAFHYISKWPARIAAFALLVGVPFGELPYGYYNFAKLCRDEATVRAFEKVAPQEFMCIDDLYSDVYRMLVGVGFSKIEFRGGTNIDFRNNAAIHAVRVKRGEEKSVYCFSTKNNIRLPWRVWRYDHLVHRVVDGRVALRQSGFSWAGMWWQEGASPILGRGGNCGDPLVRLFAAVRNGTS